MFYCKFEVMIILFYFSDKTIEFVLFKFIRSHKNKELLFEIDRI